MQKKRSLRQNKTAVILYILFHLAVFAAFLFMVLSNKELNINADLFSMMPSSAEYSVKNEAERILTEDNADKVIILVSSEEFSKARNAAEEVYNKLKDSSNFINLSLYADVDSVNDVMEFLHKYRYNLLDSSTVEMLSTQEGAKIFSDNALAKAYGIFTLSSMDSLEEDPFLLDDFNFQNYLSAVRQTGTSLSPKDGVLATEYNGLWYVMLNGILSKKGAALADRKNGVSEIYSVCTPLEKDENNCIRFVYSGTPFHSYKSSTKAAREISIISVFSFTTVLLLLIFVFRTPLPIIASGLSIIISCAFGFAVTYILFGYIHMLPLVFATSLIGCCIDYSLHFFINWKMARKSSFKGLALSFLSTEICFACLYLAPFVLLKQIAVFSFSGILSAFLTTVCIYPIFDVPKKENRNLRIKSRLFVRKRNFKTSMLFTAIIMLISGIVIYACRDSLKIQNNITKLYKVDGRLKEDAVISNAVLKYSPSSWFIVSGKTAEDVLQTEEEVCIQLKNIHKSSGYGFVATSMFVPSVARQKESFESVKNLFPFAEKQYGMLGYDSSSVEVLNASYENAVSDFITPDMELPSYIKNLVSSLWIGYVDGKYYSVILPSVATNPQAYKKLANSFGNVIYADKIADVGESLDYLTRLVLIMFGIAYVIIIVVLKFFYSWKRILKIASVPVLCVTVITSVFCASGNAIDFFALIGIVLVFGLGLDYIIYIMQENSDRKIESFAVLLSFLTTAISFCTLALSSFVPVHLIGLAIFAGLTVAFIATLF